MSQNQPARPLQFSKVFTLPRIVCWGIGLVGLVLLAQSWGLLGG